MSSTILWPCSTSRPQRQVHSGIFRVAEADLQPTVLETGDGRLGYSVLDGWYPQNPGGPIRLGYRHLSHGWWQVAPGTHSVPEFLQVPRQVLLVGCDGCPINPGSTRRSLYGLHEATRESSHTPDLTTTPRPMKDARSHSRWSEGVAPRRCAI